MIRFLALVGLALATGPWSIVHAQGASAKSPQLGARMPCLSSPQDLLMIASSQLSPWCETRFDGICYSVASGRNDEVIYVAVEDSSFVTPEGIRVGSVLADVLATGAQYPWPEPGWAYRTELASGWSVAFIAGSFKTDGALLPETRAAWLFKRK